MFPQARHIRPLPLRPWRTRPVPTRRPPPALSRGEAPRAPVTPSLPTETVLPAGTDTPCGAEPFHPLRANTRTPPDAPRAPLVRARCVSASPLSVTSRVSGSCTGHGPRTSAPPRSPRPPQPPHPSRRASPPVRGGAGLADHRNGAGGAADGVALRCPGDAGRCGGAVIRRLPRTGPVALLRAGCDGKHPGDRPKLLMLIAAGGAEEVPGILEWLEWGALAADLTTRGTGDRMPAPAFPGARHSQTDSARGRPRDGCGLPGPGTRRRIPCPPRGSGQESGTLGAPPTSYGS